MIGAGLLGVGASVSGGYSGVSTQPGSAETTREAAGAEAGAEGAEDAVERRIAEDAERQRQSLIDGAVDRFGIGHEMAASIHDIAAQEGVHPSLAYGLVNTESTFRPAVVSQAGAVGLTQLLPSTAKWIAPELVQNRSQVFEEETNLRVGFRYLRYLIDKYSGDVESALTAYNRGPGTVDRILGQGGNPDNGYAGKVLAAAS